MMASNKIYPFSFDIQGIRKHNSSVDPSMKQVNLLDQVEISKVFHCDGLLLCVTKDNTKLLVWNPYVGQTRWIRPRKCFKKSDLYAIGYDNNNKVRRAGSVGGTSGWKSTTLVLIHGAFWVSSPTV
uniref:F-box associated beta-propeller type 1 domain-containing protein n=1 Tax=Brassica campestris TaxID=3711 RepID=A0A3P5ZG47_BRACM|nr:unnamed protein product [Brassica rapa]